MLQHAKFPGNVEMLNSMMVDIKDFEFVPIGDYLEEEIFYFPDDEPYSYGAE